MGGSLGDSEVRDQSFCILISNHRGECIPGMQYFVWTRLLDQTPTLVEFCRKFSPALIDNQWISSGASMDEEEDLTIENEHARETAPPHSKEYCNRWWVCNTVLKDQ